MDVTWDDPLVTYVDGGMDILGNVRHIYFLRSDAGITEERHYGWTSDIVCTSTVYDEGMYWSDSVSGIWFLSSNEVLLRRDELGTVEVVKKNLSTGAETEIYRNERSSFGYDGYTVRASTRGLSRDGGELYFGDVTSIYRLSDLSGTPEVVYRISELGDWHYFISSYVENGVLYATVCNYATDEVAVLSVQVGAHAHRWDDGQITTPATDQYEGVLTYTCTECGATKTASIPMLEHTHAYSALVTEPTCTAQGYTTYTCTCGASYIDSYVEALGHSYGAWEILVAPTCTETGTEVRECEACGETETRVADCLPHGYIGTVTEPTCTEQGYTTYTCTCGASYIGSYVDAPGHSYGLWTLLWEPDEHHDGAEERLCACGAKETRAISNNPFEDVGDSNRFKPAILWAYYNNITSGTNKEGTLFSPDATVTRGQFVMFLWRMAGKPEPTITESPFPDVQGNNSFRKAVLWAVEKGITAGQKDGTFGLNNPCTRGQVVAFLYRYAGSPEYTTDQAAFPDVSENNSFYKAVMWAVEMGITSGQSDGSFGLKGECKRNHAVTFLHRYETHEHTFVTKTVEPTCTQAGYT